jgi:TldD protein
LLNAIDVEARRFDARIRNVLATLSCEQKLVFLMTADGIITSDVQPLVRLQVTAIADDGSTRQQKLRRRGPTG